MCRKSIFVSFRSERLRKTGHWPRYTYKEEILRRAWWFHAILVVVWGVDSDCGRRWLGGILAQWVVFPGFFGIFRVFIALRSNGPHLQESGGRRSGKGAEQVKAPAKSRANTATSTSKHAKDAWLPAFNVGNYLRVDTTRCRSLWLLWWHVLVGFLETNSCCCTSPSWSIGCWAKAKICANQNVLVRIRRGKCRWCQVTTLRHIQQFTHRALGRRRLVQLQPVPAGGLHLIVCSIDQHGRYLHIRNTSVSSEYADEVHHW